MKKVLAGIAVLAFVAAAQADLLSTWTWTSSAAPQEQVDHVTVSGLTTFGGVKLTTSGNANIFGVNTLTAATNGFQFTVNVDPNYELAGAILEGTVSGSGTGPRTVNITVNGELKDTITRTSSASVTYSGDTAKQLGDLVGDNIVKFAPDVSAGSVRSGSDENIGAGGSFYFRTSLQLSGTVKETAVPEPATMSLLGLGALAMALRRKLRK